MPQSRQDATSLRRQVLDDFAVHRTPWGCVGSSREEPPTPLQPARGFGGRPVQVREGDVLVLKRTNDEPVAVVPREPKRRRIIDASPVGKRRRDEVKLVMLKSPVLLSATIADRLGAR